MNLETFDSAMAQAVENAQVGFHFEEGGCWGMARALHAQLLALGFDPQIRYKPTGFVHCWVEACGFAFDWRGTMSKLPEFGLTLWPEWLPGIAERFGVDRETLDNDTAMAEEIIAAALSMELPADDTTQV